MTTTVSICCPLFNKGKYIAETLESVLAQTERNFEILVVDNGSTDDGPATVERYCKVDDRIHLLRSPKRGPGHARNYGLANAVGEWILFLDADDLIEPNHLECLLTKSQENPDATVIASCWREFRDGAPEKITTKAPAGRFADNQLLSSAIATSPWAIHAAIVKKNLVLLIPWPEDMDGLLAEDNTFWFRVCLEGNVAYSDHAGALYRTHTQDCRTQSQDIEKWFTGVHAAVRRNISALKNKTNRELSYAHCESLMQLYSNLYRQAIRAKHTRCATLARKEASHWLRRSRSLRSLRPKMLGRHILGITLTERLKLLLQAD